VGCAEAAGAEEAAGEAAGVGLEEGDADGADVGQSTSTQGSGPAAIPDPAEAGRADQVPATAARVAAAREVVKLRRGVMAFSWLQVLDVAPRSREVVERSNRLARGAGFLCRSVRG